MQTAAYVGFRASGVAGAAASFIGFGFPAFLFMVALFSVVRTLPFGAMGRFDLQRPSTHCRGTGRECDPVLRQTSLKGVRDAVIAAFAAGMFGLGTSPILVILLAALLGLVLYKRNSLPRLDVSSPDNYTLRGRF